MNKHLSMPVPLELLEGEKHESSSRESSREILKCRTKNAEPRSPLPESSDESNHQNTARNVPVLSDTELSQLAATIPELHNSVGTSTEFFYEPWASHVLVSPLTSGENLDGWKKAGHHPNWDSLFFTRTMNGFMFAIHNSARNAIELKMLLPRLPASARWDCVFQLSSALAVLHHRGVTLEHISADCVIGIPTNDAKWTFRWIGMRRSTTFRDNFSALRAVREFGKLALEILEFAQYAGSLDDGAEGAQAVIIEKLRLCAQLSVRSTESEDRPDGWFDRPDGWFSDLLPSICESFSPVKGFWKMSLKHYQAMSLYWSGLGALAEGHHANAEALFKQALGLQPFLAAARCGLQQVQEEQVRSAIAGSRTWGAVSALQHAGVTPSVQACIAATLLRAGWIVEAWWYAVQALEESTAQDAAWKSCEENVPKEFGLSAVCKTSRVWLESSYKNARLVLSEVKRVSSQVLRSSVAFAPLAMLSGVVPSRCTCPISELLMPVPSTDLDTTPKSLSNEGLQNLLCRLSQILGKGNSSSIPNVIPWLMSSCRLGSSSLSVHVVQSSGLLIYVTDAEVETSVHDDKDDCREQMQEVAIFLEYCSDISSSSGWNAYTIRAHTLHAGHRILHATILPEPGNSFRSSGIVQSESNTESTNTVKTLLLVYSNNLIERFTLKSQKFNQQQLAIPLRPQTTSIDGLLSAVGMSSPQTPYQVMAFGVVPNDMQSLLIFIRMESRKLQMLKVGIQKRKDELKALEAHALCVSTFPEPDLAEKSQQPNSQRRTLQMNFRLNKNVGIHNNSDSVGLAMRPSSAVSGGGKGEEHRFRYVIVGGGNAAGYACREFVRLGVQKGQVLIISNEPYVPYERPAISKGFILEKAKYPGFCTCAAEGSRQDESWYHNSGIELFLSTSVISVDFKRGWLHTNTHGTVIYEFCILCTGAAPLYLDVPGAALNGIYYLRNISDGQKIIEASKACPGGTVAVIGGGFLGMESAAAMIDRGHKVLMIYRSQHLMSRLWSAEVASNYEAFFEAKGATLMPGNFVQTVESDVSGRHACALKLSCGKRVDVDFVICCVGATIPRGLFDGKLMFQGRGVKVNANFQTSEPNVYAVGDLCCFPVKVTGRKEVMEHVGHARRSAEHAVKHIMGVSKLPEYDYRPFFYSRFFNLSWVLYGDPHGQQIIRCKPGVDSLPGTKLKLCCVWTQACGRPNGIMLEGASEEEVQLAGKLVNEKYKVDMDLVPTTTCYEDLIAVLKGAKLVEGDEEDDSRPCVLSKAEISKMLQKLPLGEYSHLSTAKFRDECNLVYESATKAGSGALRGFDMLEALNHVLEPPRARFLRANLRDCEQLNACLTQFGGSAARNFSVQQDEFPSFVQFALAYSIWKSLTSGKTRSFSKSSETNSKHSNGGHGTCKHGSAQGTADQTKTNQSGLESLPESAAIFLLSHIQEAVLCLDNQLLWWQLPLGSHSIVKKNGEIPIHSGRNLPFTASIWRLCGESLAALTAQPRQLALLDASLGEIKHFISLELAGLPPALSCGLSFSNGVIAVSLGGCGRIWSLGYQDAENLPIKEALHAAMSHRHSSGTVSEAALAAKSGWLPTPSLPDHSILQPPPIAIFDIACSCADSCLVFPDFTLWCTSHSVHASVYQQGDLIRSQSHSQNQVIDTSQLCRSSYIEPMAPTMHLLDIWSAVNNTITHLEDIVSRRKGMDVEIASHINATLECCFQIDRSLHPAFHDRLQALSTTFNQKTMQVSSSRLDEENKFHAQCSRKLSDMVVLSEGESKLPITAAAVSSSGHQLLCVIQHKGKDTWFVELWVFHGQPGQWKRSWSTASEVTLANSSMPLVSHGPPIRDHTNMPLCGLSGDGMIAVTAALDVKILSVADGVLRRKLQWSQNPIESDSALCIWMSEDGQVLVIHTARGIHVWSNCSLVQSIDVAALAVGDLSGSHDVAERIASRSTAAACHINSSINSFTLAALINHSWAFILRSGDSSSSSMKQKIAYKLTREASTEVLKVWMGPDRIFFLTAGELEVWQLPDQASSSQVVWVENCMASLNWSHLEGSVPQSIGVLQPSMFLASFKLPENQTLVWTAFDPSSRVLFGWDASCSAVLCFVIPSTEERFRRDHPSPHLALNLRVTAAAPVPSLLMTSNGLAFIFSGTCWSSWMLHTKMTRSIGSSRNRSLCSCGRTCAVLNNEIANSIGHSRPHSASRSSRRSVFCQTKMGQLPRRRSDGSIPSEFPTTTKEPTTGAWQQHFCRARSAPTRRGQPSMAAGRQASPSPTLQADMNSNDGSLLWEDASREALLQDNGYKHFDPRAFVSQKSTGSARQSALTQRDGSSAPISRQASCSPTPPPEVDEGKVGRLAPIRSYSRGHSASSSRGPSPQPLLLSARREGSAFQTHASVASSMDGYSSADALLALQPALGRGGRARSLGRPASAQVPPRPPPLHKGRQMQLSANAPNQTAYPSSSKHSSLKASTSLPPRPTSVPPRPTSSRRGNELSTNAPKQAASSSSSRLLALKTLMNHIEMG